ncbi:MAG: hypothetical protein R3C60_05685 [Parvularculaceae bacterium]
MRFWLSVAAAFLVAFVVVIGDFFVARFVGVSVAEFPAFLSTDKDPFSLLCFLLAWGSVAFGVFAILTGFLAFIADDDEVDRRLPHRGFPKALPLAFVITSVMLFWLALRCPAADSIETASAVAPAAPIIEPEESPKPEAPQLASIEAAPAPPPAPAVMMNESSFIWPFKDPLIHGADIAWMNGAPSISFDNEAGLLCGMRWVAVTGSSSEEGPPERNAIRARMRALFAANALRDWLAAHPECGATQIFAVTLGQHQKSGGADPDGTATGYQRQMLIISKPRSASDEKADGLLELRQILENPVERAALYGSRRFPSAPQILTTDS